MPNAIDDLCYQLALANRIVAYEGVLDGFGHVSVRHPGDPGRYLLPRSRSPELIEASDVLEFTLDSEPVRPPNVTLYAERVIHGCIYQARSDVNAIVHHHAPAVMPFCIAGVDLVLGNDRSVARRDPRDLPSGDEGGGRMDTTRQDDPRAADDEIRHARVTARIARGLYVARIGSRQLLRGAP